MKTMSKKSEILLQVKNFWLYKCKTIIVLSWCDLFIQCWTSILIIMCFPITLV